MLLDTLTCLIHQRGEVVEEVEPPERGEAEGGDQGEQQALLRLRVHQRNKHINQPYNSIFTFTYDFRKNCSHLITSHCT